MRIILLIGFILFALSFASAQTKANDPKENKVEKPKVENVTPGVIEVDEALQRAIEAGQSEIEKAEMALELAKTKLSNIILQVRLVKGVPMDYRLRIKDGKLYFEKPPDNK